MDAPSVKNLLIDDKKGVTYEVRAYRRLSEAELMFSVRDALRQIPKKNRPKKGQTLVILSTLH